MRDRERYLEAAGCDQRIGIAGQDSDQRLATRCPRADAGPFFHDLGADKGRTEEASALDHRVELLVSRSRIFEIVFRG